MERWFEGVDTIVRVPLVPPLQFAVASQVSFHGFDPKDAVVEVSARDGEDCLRTEDIEATIAAHGDSVALVLFSGVQYYTGQFFDVSSFGLWERGGHAIA